jgi:hypothetical protein
MAYTPKSAFNKRIHRERRWDEWINHREQVKKLPAYKGVKAGIIWQVASFEFQPLDGSPHEIPRTPEIAKYLDNTSRAEVAAELGADEPAAAPIADTAPVIEAPPIPTKGNAGWKVYARNLSNNATNAAASATKRDEVWAKLAYEVDRTKRCAILEAADWIYQNMGTPPELLTAGEVPSPGALWHLRDLQENVSTRQDFLRTWMVKTIPDKRQMEFESKRNQGSTKIFGILDQFDEQFAEEHGLEAVA